MAGSFSTPLPNRLPQPLTSFIGREQEAAELIALLRDPIVRLLTLIGPGGVGKTRLALHVAEALSDDLDVGVTFIPLATIESPTLVAPTIGHAFGFTDSGEHMLVDRLAALLGERPWLLILDNVERLLETAPLAARLLDACHGLTIVATSRVALRVSGEREFTVPPLALPPVNASQEQLDESPAVRLFGERSSMAVAAKGGEVSRERMATIAAICQRLDGLPLAIELAAARTRVLTPEELLRRLQLRLPLLSSGPRNAPARLQTMRGAIGWSYDMLRGDEQALFRTLSVFTGGFSLDAAEAVMADVVLSLDTGSTQRSQEVDHSLIDLLESLLTQSLLDRIEAVDGSSRFSMLETIREFGLECLAASGEAESVRRRHAAWLLSRLDAPHLQGTAVSLATPDPFLDDHDNARNALQWALERKDASLAARLAWGLTPFWQRNGFYVEARAAYACVFQLDALLDKFLHAGLLISAARMTWQQSDFSETRELAEAALQLCRGRKDRSGVAASLQVLALALLVENPSAAIDRLEESLAIQREIGPPSEVAHTLMLLGSAMMYRGDLSTAKTCFAEAEIMGLDEGKWAGSGVHRGSSGLAWIALVEGELDLAESYGQQGLDAARIEGNHFQHIGSLRLLGQAAWKRGDYHLAATRLQEALGLVVQMGMTHSGCYCLAELAAVAQASGESAIAARFLGAESALREALHLIQTPDERTIREQTEELARCSLGIEAFTAAWRSGAALTAAAAFTEALAWIPPEPVARRVAVAGLTQRELEVLHYLVAGETDRAIADALFVSRRTVNAHVASILSKMGVQSRKAAAAHAVRLGLD
jgi:predicted ATPase/DNA-binding CsgD family transcriptional regulator